MSEGRKGRAMKTITIAQAVDVGLRAFDAAVERRALAHANDFLAAGKRADEVEEIMAAWHQDAVLPHRQAFEASLRRKLHAMRES